MKPVCLMIRQVRQSWLKDQCKFARQGDIAASYRQTVGRFPYHPDLKWRGKGRFRTHAGQGTRLVIVPLSDRLSGYQDGANTPRAAENRA